MLIYIVNFILICIYGTLIKNKKILVLITGVQLFTILACKDISTTKVDIAIYESAYNYIGQFSFIDMVGRLHFFKSADLVWSYSLESGYVLLNWVAVRLGMNFQLFLVLYDAFIVTSWSFLIYKYSKDPAFSYVFLIGLGFFTHSFYIIRQSFSVCLLIWAYDKIKKEDTKGFWILWILAFLIHRGAIVFLLLYLFRNKKVTKKLFSLFLLFGIIIILLAPFFYKYVIIPLLAMIGKSSYAVLNFKFNNQIILMIGIGIIIDIFVDFKKRGMEENYTFLYALIISIYLESIGMCNDGFARIIEFVYIYIVILLPNMISINCKRRNIVLYKWIISCSLLVFYIYTLSGSYIVPYKSILE